MIIGTGWFCQIPRGANIMPPGCSCRGTVRAIIPDTSCLCLDFRANKTGVACCFVSVFKTRWKLMKTMEWLQRAHQEEPGLVQSHALILAGIKTKSKISVLFETRLHFLNLSCSFVSKLNTVM